MSALIHTHVYVVNLSTKEGGDEGGHKILSTLFMDAPFRGIENH